MKTSSIRTPSGNLAPMRPGTRWVPMRVARLLIERHGPLEAGRRAIARKESYVHEVCGVRQVTHPGRWLYWRTVVSDIVRYPYPSQLEALLSSSHEAVA